MASWRIGYMVIPEHLFEAVNKIQDTNLICPPVVSQAVALRRARRRARLLPRASRRTRRASGSWSSTRSPAVADLCTVPRPDGAFYCLVRVHTSMDPLALVERLIVDHRVAAVPGTAFGLTGGCYLRVSYGALDRETVAEGIVAPGRDGLRALVVTRLRSADARRPPPATKVRGRVRPSNQKPPFRM